MTHWKPKLDGTVEDLNLEPKGNNRTLKWSEVEKMFRCEGEDRLIDKIIKTAEHNERLKAEAEKKLLQIQQSPKSRVGHGKTASQHDSSYQNVSPRAGDQIRTQQLRNSAVRNAPLSGGSEAPLSSAFSKNVPVGNYTSRGANMNYSLPNLGGSNLVGTLSYMGKTTLFSRVALSPNAAKGGDKKESALSQVQKPNTTDYETNAST